jgi:hypothetical protein
MQVHCGFQEERKPEVGRGGWKDNKKKAMVGGSRVDEPWKN